MAIRDDLLTLMLQALKENNAPTPIDEDIANKSLKSIAYPVGDQIEKTGGSVDHLKNVTSFTQWMHPVPLGLTWYYYEQADVQALGLPVPNCFVVRIFDDTVTRACALCFGWARGSEGLWWNVLHADSGGWLGWRKIG